MDFGHAFAQQGRNETGTWEVQMEHDGRNAEKLEIEIQKWRGRCSHVRGILHLRDATQD